MKEHAGDQEQTAGKKTARNHLATEQADLELDLELDIYAEHALNQNTEQEKSPITSTYSADATSHIEPMTSAVPDIPSESVRQTPVEMYYEREIMVEGDIENAPTWKVAVAYLKALFPGLFHPGVLIVSILGMIFGFFLLLVGLAAVILFQFGGVHTAIVVGSVGMIVYGQSVAWMIWGEFENFLSMSFVPTQWAIFAVLWFLPITIAILGMLSMKP